MNRLLTSDDLYRAAMSMHRANKRDRDFAHLHERGSRQREKAARRIVWRRNRWDRLADACFAGTPVETDYSG